MKDLLEPINTIVWNALSDMCLFFQGALSTTWLIILGIVVVILAAICADESCKDEYGEENVWYTLVSTAVFITVYGTVFCIGWYDFKKIDQAESNVWIVVPLMCVSIILCLLNKKIFFSISFIVGAIVSAALFSKFVVALGILLGLGALMGGSSYVGTFTDKYGNSYDIFKRD